MQQDFQDRREILAYLVLQARLVVLGLRDRLVPQGRVAVLAHLVRWALVALRVKGDWMGLEETLDQLVQLVCLVYRGKLEEQASLEQQVRLGRRVLLVFQGQMVLLEQLVQLVAVVWLDPLVYLEEPVKLVSPESLVQQGQQGTLDQ